jgi:hypothetical protein
MQAMAALRVMKGIQGRVLLAALQISVLPVIQTPLHQAKETREGLLTKVVVVEAQASLLRQMVTGLVAVAAVEQVQSIRDKTQLTVALVVEALAEAGQVVMVLLTFPLARLTPSPGLPVVFQEQAVAVAVVVSVVTKHRMQ